MQPTGGHNGAGRGLLSTFAPPRPYHFAACFRPSLPRGWGGGGALPRYRVQGIPCGPMAVSRGKGGGAVGCRGRSAHSMHCNVCQGHGVQCAWRHTAHVGAVLRLHGVNGGGGGTLGRVGSGRCAPTAAPPAHLPSSTPPCALPCSPIAPRPPRHSSPRLASGGPPPPRSLWTARRGHQGPGSVPHRFGGLEEERVYIACPKPQGGIVFSGGECDTRASTSQLLLLPLGVPLGARPAVPHTRSFPGKRRTCGARAHTHTNRRRALGGEGL